jgi:hypothetical protein
LQNDEKLGLERREVICPKSSFSTCRVSKISQIFPAFAELEGSEG